MSYENTLLELCERDPEIVVMTAENRAAIRNLPEKLGARFIDVGICEQTMVGAAAGLALRGRKPITHALATFLTLRAFEFIRTDVGIPGLPVSFVGGVPGFLSEANGPTHQAIEDVALMRGIPNMQVLCPADEVELDHALRAAFASGKPTYIRHYAGPARTEHQPYEIGRAEVLHDGHDVTLLTYGMLLSHVLLAREALEKRGVSTRVANVRSLSPIDDRAILRAASDSKLLVTIEDHFQTGGLFSIVAETLALAGKGTRVLPIALDKKWFRPALLPDVLRVEGFRGEDLANRVKAVLET